MKSLTFNILILTLILSGCSKNSDSGSGYFDSMRYTRQGAGQIDFKIYTTESSEKFTAIVSKFNFRDTTLQITINNNSDNASAFTFLNKAMTNQISLNGNFQQSTSLTGTWSYIYMVTNGSETEVKNIELRNSLMKFEQIIKDNIH